LIEGVDANKYVRVVKYGARGKKSRSSVRKIWFAGQHRFVYDSACERTIGVEHNPSGL
jgi:hypothetical protein